MKALRMVFALVLLLLSSILAEDFYSSVWSNITFGLQVGSLIELQGKNRFIESGCGLDSLKNKSLVSIKPTNYISGNPAYPGVPVYGDGSQTVLDKNGKIWTGTTKGVCRYVYVSDLNDSAKYYGKAQGLPADTVVCLKYDKTLNRLFVGTKDGSISFANLNSKSEPSSWTIKTGIMKRAAACVSLYGQQSFAVFGQKIISISDSVVNYFDGTAWNVIGGNYPLNVFFTSSGQIFCSLCWSGGLMRFDGNNIWTKVYDFWANDSGYPTERVAVEKVDSGSIVWISCYSSSYSLSRYALEKIKIDNQGNFLSKEMVYFYITGTYLRNGNEVVFVDSIYPAGANQYLWLKNIPIASGNDATGFHCDLWLGPGLISDNDGNFSVYGLGSIFQKKSINAISWQPPKAIRQGNYVYSHSVTLQGRLISELVVKNFIGVYIKIYRQKNGPGIMAIKYCALAH